MSGPEPLRWDVAPLDAPRGTGPRVPGYLLEAPLGAGGMGTVYRAVDEEGREVALKVLAPFGGPRAAERFEREAQLLARFRHPGFVAVHDHGRTDEGLSWLACELVVGDTIDVAAAKLDVAARLDLVEHVARAVGAAHAAGVVHRDLKPANILVDRATGRPKVIDFGVSLGEGVLRLTATGQFLGTPLYAPPERWTGGPDQDAPTGDVWALAAVAYELLTGEHPYPAETVADLHRRTAPAPSPRGRCPGLGRAAAELLVRALSPRPEERPSDGLAFAEALVAARTRTRRRLRTALGAVALVTWGAVLGMWVRRPPPPTPPPHTTTPPPATETQATAAQARAGALLDADRASDALALLGDDRSDAGRLLRCRALAALERWEELRGLVVGEQPPAALRRLRGIASLLLDDPASAAVDLAPGDPHLRLDGALVRLAAAGRRSSEAQAPLRAAAEAVVDAARGLPLSEPGGAAGRRRAQAGVRDALLLLGPAAEEAEVAARRELVGKAQGLVSAAAAEPGLQVAVTWSSWVEALRAARGADEGERWLLEHDPGWPAGAWLERQPPRVRAVVAAVGLVRLGLGPEPLADDAVAGALAAAKDAPGQLEGLGAAGALLAGLTRRARAIGLRDEASRARRRGQPEQAQAALAEAQRLVAAPADGDGAARDVEDELVRGSIYVANGQVPVARSTIRRAEAGGVATTIVQVEAAIVYGDLAVVPQKLAALRARLERLADPALEALLARMELHRRVLAGELRPEEALGSIPPDPPGPRPALRVWAFEWHTPAGLAEVLRGGWWPGKNPKGR